MWGECASVKPTGDSSALVLSRETACAWYNYWAPTSYWADACQVAVSMLLLRKWCHLLDAFSSAFDWCFDMLSKPTTWAPLYRPALSFDVLPSYNKLRFRTSVIVKGEKRRKIILWNVIFLLLNIDDLMFARNWSNSTHCFGTAKDHFSFTLQFAKQFAFPSKVNWDLMERSLYSIASMFCFSCSHCCRSVHVFTCLFHHSLLNYWTH